MTSKASMLSNIWQYLGIEYVLIGDGSSFPILGIGDLFIKQKKNYSTSSWCLTCPWFNKIFALYKPTNKIIYC